MPATPPVMTPERLQECLDILHWSNRALADEIDGNERLVRRMMAGETTVPPKVAAWLERLVAYHQKHPAPQDWRRRMKVAA